MYMFIFVISIISITTTTIYISIMYKRIDSKEPAASFLVTL